MSDSATLLELAERCEAATGPDRELDIAIQDGIGLLFMPWNANQNDWLTPIGGELVEVSRSGKGGASGDRFCLRYTASLDAAMTLVPVGWGYCIEQERPTRACEACLSPPGSEPWGPGSIDAEAATPALALCAAALKSRSSTTSDLGGEEAR